jgi:hypothetical protein
MKSIKKNLFTIFLIILVNLTLKSFAVEPASQPVEMKLFSFCLQDVCEVSVILENKTAFEIELITPLANDLKFSDQGITFYEAEDYYNGANSFANPIKVKQDKFSPLNDNVRFKPLEKKAYKININKLHLGLINDTEYIVLSAILNIVILVEGKKIEYMSLMSEPGFVMGEWK